MIAWIDVETTGIDPKGNHLLEVGIALTDDNLKILTQTSVCLELPPNLRATLSPEILEMHEKNGLLTSCERYSFTREEAQFRLIRFLTEYAEPEPVMAGNTVSFDRNWLQHKMPLLEHQFHYRSIDVSSLKELNKRWHLAPKWTGDRKTHRAIPDIEDSIAELQHYRDHIQPHVNTADEIMRDLF